MYDIKEVDWIKKELTRIKGINGQPEGLDLDNSVGSRFNTPYEVYYHVKGV